MTFHKQPRLKVAPAVVDRMKQRSSGNVFRAGRGRNIRQVIEELRPVLRGWVNYFRLAEVKGIFEELDGWIRRKLRCILWRQWKTALHSGKEPDEAWFGGRAGLEVRHERAWPLVELRGLPHEPVFPQALL